LSQNITVIKLKSLQNILLRELVLIRGGSWDNNYGNWVKKGQSAQVLIFIAAKQDAFMTDITSLASVLFGAKQGFWRAD
jgi:hypothetical protein